VTSKEPNIDTGNQDMNIGAETMSLKDKKVWLKVMKWQLEIPQATLIVEI
jgi:hypothetical protein